MIARSAYTRFCLSLICSFALASPASAELYLMFNVGDNEDREVPDAGTTIVDARDGVRPDVIDSNAERYIVHLPFSTMDTLSGSATRVGEAARSTENATSVSIASIGKNC